MELKDIFTVVLTSLNLLLLVYISFFELRANKKKQAYSYRKTWYDDEILNQEKIRVYYDKLTSVVTNSALPPVQKCYELGDAMAAFMFTVVDYVKFIDSNYCSSLKKQILASTDELMKEILKPANVYSTKSYAKLVNIQRIKLLNMLYDFDVLQQLNAK